MDPVRLQRDYYARTAPEYDKLHSHETPAAAIAFLSAMIEAHGFRSILDIGSGTGRVVSELRARAPGLEVVGVEPVEALRKEGHSRGVPEDALVDGDATRLDYGPGTFDLVCAFSVLHHIPKPELAVREMLRVAAGGIFILDNNNFAQGSGLARAMKQTLNALGLWPLANFVRTRGRGYMQSEGDGIFYSYSVFSSYPAIRQHCKSVHFLNVSDGGRNLYRTADVVALLGLKR